MRFGLFHIARWHETMTDEQTLLDSLEEIELADRLGIGEIWVGEHHFSRHGLVSGVFSYMGAVAARTKRARIGTAVVVLPVNNPVRVAEEAAMLDIISGGRFDLGIGAGYQAQEFHGLGSDLEESRERFREYVDVILKSWAEEPLTHHGKFVNIDNIDVMPKPVQKPHPPLYIAVSTSPESVDYAASRAIPVMLGGPTASMGQVPEVMARWHERMEHYGHPHEDIDLPVAMSIYVAPTMEEAENDMVGLGDHLAKIFAQIGTPIGKDGRVPKGYEHWVHRQKDREQGVEVQRQAGILPLIGTPEVVAERLEILRSKGLNRLFSSFGAAGLPQEKTLRSIEMFAKEVIPNFVQEPVEVGD